MSATVQNLASSRKPNPILTPTNADPLDTSITTQEELRRQRAIFKRRCALLMLGFSFAGTVLTLNDNFSAFSSWDAITMRLVVNTVGKSIVGFVLQYYLTKIEWMFREDWKSPIYLLALLVDAGMTGWGFFPIFAPFIIAFVTYLSAPDSIALIVAVLVLGVLAFANALLPEQILVKREDAEPVTA